MTITINCEKCHKIIVCDGDGKPTNEIWLSGKTHECEPELTFDNIYEMVPPTPWRSVKQALRYAMYYASEPHATEIIDRLEAENGIGVEYLYDEIRNELPPTPLCDNRCMMRRWDCDGCGKVICFDHQVFREGRVCTGRFCLDCDPNDYSDAT